MLKSRIGSAALHSEIEFLQEKIHDKESKIRMTRNCLTKAKKSQSFYERKSQFMKSAEWIIIINNLTALLNVHNEKAHQL